MPGLVIDSGKKLRIIIHEVNKDDPRDKFFILVFYDPDCWEILGYAQVLAY